MILALVEALISGGTRLLTGAQARWLGCGPSDVQRVYYANHASHMDFVLIWSVLPPRLRRKTRPGRRHRLLEPRRCETILDSPHLSRRHGNESELRSRRQPNHGHVQRPGSGCVPDFVSGGYPWAGRDVLPFRAGVYHLAQAYASVELVPVWVDNSYRIMPKGTLFPYPCSALCVRKAAPAGDGRTQE